MVHERDHCSMRSQYKIYYRVVDHLFVLDYKIELLQIRHPHASQPVVASSYSIRTIINGLWSVWTIVSFPKI